MDCVAAVVGDFNPENWTHVATGRALDDAELRFEWLRTSDLETETAKRLAAYDGVWIAPGSPYVSMTGALNAIRYARERGVPLIGT